MDFLDDDLFSDDDVFHFFIDDWKNDPPEDDAPEAGITSSNSLSHNYHFLELQAMIEQSQNADE
ncbi:hypothetical protein [Haloferula sp.]|uniref:hypothetical protein n=1 Tax=Haloferula sp. TaxID=2497595 RepID=UPI00329F769A